MSEAAGDELYRWCAGRCGGPLSGDEHAEVLRRLCEALYIYQMAGARPKVAEAGRLLGRLYAARGEHDRAANCCNVALDAEHDEPTYQLFERCAAAAGRYRQLAVYVHRRALRTADPAARCELLARADGLYRRDNTEFRSGRDRNCCIDLAAACAQLGRREQGLHALSEALAGCPAEFAGAFADLRRRLLAAGGEP